MSSAARVGRNSKQALASSCLFAAEVLQAVAVGIGAHQLGGDFGAIDRGAINAEVAADCRHVEAGEVEDLGHPRVGQQRLQVGGFVVSLGELHQMADPVAGGKLQQAETVAGQVQAHGLAVDGDAVASPAGRSPWWR